MFSAPLSDDTIPRYSNVMSMIIMMHYQLVTVSNPLTPPLLSETQSEAVTALYAAITERQPDADVRNLLHVVLSRLLIHEFTDEQSDATSDPVSMGLIWYNWDKDGSFKKASDITQTLAAIQFVARSTVVTQTYTVRTVTNASYSRYGTSFVHLN